MTLKFVATAMLAALAAAESCNFCSPGNVAVGIIQDCYIDASAQWICSSQISGVFSTDATTLALSASEGVSTGTCNHYQYGGSAYLTGSSSDVTNVYVGGLWYSCTPTYQDCIISAGIASDYYVMNYCCSNAAADTSDCPPQGCGNPC